MTDTITLTLSEAERVLLADLLEYAGDEVRDASVAKGLYVRLTGPPHLANAPAQTLAHLAARPSGSCDCMDPRHVGPLHPRRDADVVENYAPMTGASTACTKCGMAASPLSAFCTHKVCPARQFFK